MAIEFRIRIVLLHTGSNDGLAGRALTPEEYELGYQPLGACLDHEVRESVLFLYLASLASFCGIICSPCIHYLFSIN